MNDVFISHVEEDDSVALETAQSLEAAGYSTWYYERDSLPGLSHLLQTGRGIEQSQAVIVLISAGSLSSWQVDREIDHAHECGKPFVPLLLDIKHVEFQNRQPKWRMAMGTTASIQIPPQGISAVVPRIIRGLEALGIKPARSNLTVTRDKTSIEKEKNKAGSTHIAQADLGQSVQANRYRANEYLDRRPNNNARESGSTLGSGRQTRRKNILFLGLAVALVVVAAGSVWGVYKWQAAEHARRQAILEAEEARHKKEQRQAELRRQQEEQQAELRLQQERQRQAQMERQQRQTAGFGEQRYVPSSRQTQQQQLQQEWQQRSWQAQDQRRRQESQRLAQEEQRTQREQERQRLAEVERQRRQQESQERQRLAQEEQQRRQKEAEEREAQRQRDQLLRGGVDTFKRLLR